MLTHLLNFFIVKRILTGTISASESFCSQFCQWQFLLELSNWHFLLYRGQCLLQLCRFWGSIAVMQLIFSHSYVGGSFCCNYAGDCFSCNYVVRIFCSKNVGDNFYCNYACWSLCCNYAGDIFCKALCAWLFDCFYCNYAGDCFCCSYVGGSFK